MFTTSIYQSSPILIQNILLSIRSLLRSVMREGRRFELILADIEKTQWFSEEKLAQYQMESLIGVLDAAHTSVPYYRENWPDKIGKLGSHELQDILAQFPLLTKQDIKTAGKRLVADNVHRNKLFTHHTSGTTGAPLTLFQDILAITREHAFVQRQLHWAGYKEGDRRAWFRGDMIVPTTIDKPPFWRIDFAGNMLVLSSYHLSLRYASDYVDALARFDPVVIQAYPSSIAFLASYLDSVGQEYSGPSLKGIVTSSETLSEQQRHVIEKRFGCRVYDWYGQNERVAAIGTCEHGSYHLMSDYSYCEFMPSEDGTYEIIGTGFGNSLMPLIRYRTGDLVNLADNKKCACGRSFPVINRIVGRQSSYIKLKDGRRVASNCITMIFETGMDGILESQIVQDDLNELVVKVVPAANYSDSLERQLRNDASERLGHQIAVRVMRCDSIDRTGNGKLREVICNIKD